MNKTQPKSHKSHTKIPKYSAPKSNCDACKKQTNTKNRSLPAQNYVLHERPSNTKLFSIIESFHNNLCSLPLDILLSNQRQEQWLTQQYRTLNSLSNKLEQVREDPQSEYYRAKIETVRLVLQNIEANLQILGNLKYQSVKSQRNSQYNYYSSGSSSISESNKNINIDKHKLQQLLADSDTNSDYQRSLDFSAESNRNQTKYEYNKYEKQNDRLQSNNTMRQKTLKNINQQQLLNNTKMFRTQKIYEEKRLDSGVNTIQSSHAETITCKDRVYEQSLYQIEEKPHSQYDQLCYQAKQNYRKNLASIKNSLKTQNDFNCLKTYKSQINEQIEQEQKQQQSPPNKTKRLQKLVPSLQKQTQHKPSKTQETIQNNSTQIFTNFDSKKEDLAIKIEYLTEKIKQMQMQLVQVRDDLTDKNKQIEQLLISNQQLQEVVEIFKTERIALKESSQYSLERISLLQRNNEGLQAELNQWKARQKDLRLTINQHERHIHQLQNINIGLKNQIEQEVEEMKSMREQAQGLILQVQQCKKRQSIIKQQLNIYKNKNRQLINNQQLNKLISKETYAGKNQKVKQLRDIIHQHRLNLEDSGSLRKRSQTLMKDFDQELYSEEFARDWNSSSLLKN